jgi:hypothetical protein
VPPSGVGGCCSRLVHPSPTDTTDTTDTHTTHTHTHTHTHITTRHWHLCTRARTHTPGATQERDSRSQDSCAGAPALHQGANSAGAHPHWQECSRQVACIVTLQIKYTRTLTFQNFSPALGAGQYGVSEHERRFNAAKMSCVRNI